MGSSQTPAAHALVALGDTFNWLGVFGLEIVSEVFFPNIGSMENSGQELLQNLTSVPETFCV